MFGGGFSADKLKANAKMAVHRMALLSNKKKNTTENQKREIAAMLRESKDEKVESVIRDDFTVEAYEILQLYCELVAERIRLVNSMKECPPDMVETVCTILFAAPRTDVPELIQVAKQLQKKYGKELTAKAARNTGGCVNARVVDRLAVSPPDAELVLGYLRAIAAEQGVQWEPKAQDFGGGGGGGGGGLGQAGYSVDPSAASGYAHLQAGPAAASAPLATPYGAPPSTPGFPAPPAEAPPASAAFPQPPAGAPAFPQPPAGAPAFPQPPAGAPAFPQPPAGAPAFPQPPAGAPAFPQPPTGAPAFPQPPAGAPAFPPPPAGGAGAAGAQDLPDEDEIARRLAALRGGQGGSV